MWLYLCLFCIFECWLYDISAFLSALHYEVFMKCVHYIMKCFFKCVESALTKHLLYSDLRCSSLTSGQRLSSFSYQRQLVIDFFLSTTRVLVPFSLGTKKTLELRFLFSREQRSVTEQKQRERKKERKKKRKKERGPTHKSYSHYHYAQP